MLIITYYRLQIDRCVWALVVHKLAKIRDSITFILLSLFSLVACEYENETRLQEPEPSENVVIDSQVEEPFESIELDYGFKIVLGQKEDFQSFVTFSRMELSRNGNLIFIDSSLTEYQAPNGMYSIFSILDTNTFEILLEVNDKPSRNYLKRLIISKGKVLREDKLPSFIGKSIEVFGNGLEYYFGYWDYAQVWGENNELTAYNPLLVFKSSESGLTLDSALTIQQNEKIYGQFSGYRFSESIEVPVESLEKFNRHIDSLKNIK